MNYSKCPRSVLVQKTYFDQEQQKATESILTFCVKPSWTHTGSRKTSTSGRPQKVKIQQNSIGIVWTTTKAGCWWSCRLKTAVTRLWTRLSILYKFCSLHIGERMHVHECAVWELLLRSSTLLLSPISGKTEGPSLSYTHLILFIVQLHSPSTKKYLLL